jgi:hypothetical protein
MITDPGTPGNGRWKNNFAFAFEHRPNETSIDVPAIDLNYGVGDHIQLRLQTAPTPQAKRPWPDWRTRRNRAGIWGRGSVPKTSVRLLRIMS